MLKFKLFLLLVRYSFLAGWYEAKYERYYDERDIEISAAYLILAKQVEGILKQ